MVIRSDFSERPGSIERGIQSLGDPWTLLVLREAFAGATRFHEFAERLDATDKVLNTRLKTLVADGLLERRVTGTGERPRARYILTDAGAASLPVLHALALWADANHPHPDGLRLDITCRHCGHSATSADVCTSCGRRLEPGNVRWTFPHGSEPTTVDLSGAAAAVPERG